MGIYLNGLDLGIRFKLMSTSFCRLLGFREVRNVLMTDSRINAFRSLCISHRASIMTVKLHLITRIATFETKKRLIVVTIAITETPGPENMAAFGIENASTRTHPEKAMELSPNSRHPILRIQVIQTKTRSTPQT